MKFYVLVVVICFGVSLVSSSEQHQNEHKHSKEKSHKSNHYRSQHHISNRHHQKAGVRHHNHGSHFSQHAYRANPISQHCSWVCQEEPPTTPTFGLQIIFNSSASLFSVVNEQSRTALTIEYKLNVIMLLSGQTGTMTVFNLQTKQIITVPQIPGVSWISSKSSFRDYIKKFNIENLLQIAQQKGQIQGLDQLPNITIKLIEEQLSSLGLNFPFKDALKIIASFANQLSNGLSVLYQGANIFNIPNNLKWLFNINSVLSELLKTNGFDLSNINIDSSQLFNGSGIQVLFNLFSQLANHVNLSNFFNNIVNSRDKTIQLLSNTSAGSHNGLDGLITILVNVAKFLSQQGSIGDIITAVAKYNSTSTDEPTFAQVINQGLEILKTQTKSFPNCEGAAQLIKFFEALNNNNLVFNNVNIFDILKVLFSPNPLDRVNTVIKVLSCFLPQRGIPAFFNFIKDVLNNTGDASVLTHLIPGLDISKFFGNGNPLQNIFQGQNASQLFSADNIAATLSNIPIFGEIAKQISSGTEGLTHSIPGLGNIGTAANSSQGGSADFGGIINSIQNGLGGLFGLGNGLFPSSLPLTTRSASASTVAEASSETSSTETGISGSSEASISAANPGVTSGSQQITDSSSITGGSSTEQSSTSAGGFGQLLQGLQNPFGLRGIIGGEVTGNLHIGDRKAHRGTRSKQTHGE